MPSIEEKVEEYYKGLLDKIGLRHFAKTEHVNDSIENALKESNSKGGGSGNNFPDIKCLIDNKHGRIIPVMIEAKGTKGKLEKLTKDGEIAGVIVGKDGKPSYTAVTQFAVNGALHYGQAIVEGSNYEEVIIVGVNGSTLKDGKVENPEYKAYYLSKKNYFVPKLLTKLDAEWSLFKPSMVDTLCKELDDMNLTEAEREKLVRNTEATLETRIHEIHQRLYDDAKLRSQLNTNDKLYLFCGLIMAGLSVEGVAPLTHADFKGNDSDMNPKAKNDGIIVIDQGMNPCFLKMRVELVTFSCELIPYHNGLVLQ